MNTKSEKTKKQLKSWFAAEHALKSKFDLFKILIFKIDPVHEIILKKQNL